MELNCDISVPWSMGSGFQGMAVSGVQQYWSDPFTALILFFLFSILFFGESVSFKF